MEVSVHETQILKRPETKTMQEVCDHYFWQKIIVSKIGKALVWFVFLLFFSQTSCRICSFEVRLLLQMRHYARIV